ncbi:MAG: hypothetical protein M1817_002017 [Caeruleum heppii]|nr:MAG: hypothetical protein M1817_002017 [Caeruleum heppii]
MADRSPAAGAHSKEPDHLNPYHSATGPASATAGPHKHNILNKLDPRVDSDLDGSKTSGSPRTSTTASTPTASTPTTSNYATSSQTTPSQSPISTSCLNTRANASSQPHSFDASPGINRPPAPGYTNVNPHMGAGSTGPGQTGNPSLTAAQRLNPNQQPTTQDFAAAQPNHSTAHKTPSSSAATTLDPRVDAPDHASRTRAPVGAVPAEKESIWHAGSTPGHGNDKEAVQPPKNEVPKTGLHHAPTDSHALATASHDLKGTSQQYHEETEVKDLGWDTSPEHVPAPLVGGLPNEELWTLVRRFDKQMYHVKAISGAPPGGLDLNIADEEEFSPDKLRSNLERLYMTVIVGVATFGKHIARLRSWREPRRTAGFAVIYLIAWFFDFLIPALITMILTLIVYPPARSFLFPHAPLALVDAKTGGMKKPTAGMLGSHDSMTGAAEKHQGEAVEQEAHNFVSSLAAIGLSSATGKHPANATQESGGTIDSSVPDPTDMAGRASEAKHATSGGTAKHDKTKQPMEEAMWSKARPVMHILADVADNWERFGNALSPTPPFPRDGPRLRLAALVAPLVAVSLVVDSAMFMKGTTFGVGFGFFGDPVLSRGFAWLNRTFPNWKKILEIRNTILRGVPTNAQLTLTLLRIGEANRAPLPPPPSSEHPPSSRPPSLHGDDVPLDASHEEVQDAIHPDRSADMHDQHEDGKKAKKPNRIVGALKSTTKAAVSASLGTDRLKAAAGSGHARNRLGVLPNPNEDNSSGPVDFKARYQGKRGYVYISTAATTPCISFTLDRSSVEKSVDRSELKPVWSVALADIKELKKIGGLGWKVKLVVGWAMDREVADGLEIVDRAGHSWVMTAIPLREELFNRLVALGGQKWESW